MAPEGVVHALGRIHRTLVPGGLLLDLHPIPPDGVLESGGVALGRLDAREFFARVRATEAGLEKAVGEGLFTREAEVEFDFIERFDSASEALETVAGWDGYRVPARAVRRVRAAAPPIDVRERVVLRRLRALEATDRNQRS